MSTIVTKLQGWALTLAAVVLVLLGAYAIGGRAAKKAANKQQQFDEARRAAAGATEVHHANQEVEKMGNGAAAIQLRAEWMRPDAQPDEKQ